MSYSNIQNIKYASVTSNNYFVDAQIWIYALQGDSSLDWWQLQYVDFFYSIVDSTIEPKPKIVVPTILFSEILNTWIKGIALKEFQAGMSIEEIRNFNFKKQYRTTTHYKENFEKVCDDILSLKNSLIFINDFDLISNPPVYINTEIDPFDFNDYLYYLICKEYQKRDKISIVTNDSDFQISDIPIITNNRDLISLKKSGVAKPRV